MNIVALHNLKDDRQNLAGALAAALGVTIYEAASRLRAQGDAAVVAVHAEYGPAEQLAAKLNSCGFASVVVTADDIERERHQVIARRFNLGERELVVESGNERLGIAYDDIEVILRGTGISQKTSTETSKESRLSLGRAVLSGGMSFTKTTKTVREVSTEAREGFLALYAEGRPALLFRENSVAYDSLGAAMKHSSAANFAYLGGEIRQRCRNAIYDERLINRAAQAALLGPSLRPEEHLAVATALLSGVLGYRKQEHDT